MAASDNPFPAPEFSRPFAVDSLNDGQAELAYEATEEERTALAERFELQALNALSFTATVAPWRGGVRVSGTVSGEAVQTCVVTLGPVVESVSDTFDRGFLPRDVLPFPEEKAGQEIEIRMDREIGDAADRLTPVLDLGEIAAEAFSLALDPYPRAPDASVEGLVAGPPGVAPLTDDDVKPFAALARLKPAAGPGKDDSENE